MSFKRLGLLMDLIPVVGRRNSELVVEYLNERERKYNNSLSDWLAGVAGWGGQNRVRVDLYRASHTIES